MRTINRVEYGHLTAGAAPLGSEFAFNNVLLRSDGVVVKRLRKRGPYSSYFIRSQAESFRRNAERLRRLGIVTVAVLDVFDYPDEKRHLVTYERLPGVTLKEVMHQESETGSLLPEFAAYVARLHRKGIYFRSLHFGNVLVQAGNVFGLIDVVDMRFRRHALYPWMRGRNIRHLFRRHEDAKLMRKFGIQRFMDAYFAAADLSRPSRWATQLFVPRTSSQNRA